MQVDLGGLQASEVSDRKGMEVELSLDPCEKEAKELREATEEWDIWTKRASLPPGMTAIKENIPTTYLSEEKMEELRKATEEEHKAKKRYLRALEAFSQCRKKHGR